MVFYNRGNGCLRRCEPQGLREADYVIWCWLNRSNREPECDYRQCSAMADRRPVVLVRLK